ncbi:MAG: hypothetical protein LC135_14675 [Phycisphaerae bacterium]|jgi:hypothetical protein|nr:hypothetical protein [Phycisphaerae bacterium]MCZ2401087.1 hypothetical protein [Phycisphaerae bacterium]NUQ49216.1 hypothetical protein [Phycisphaerae bacterium]
MLDLWIGLVVTPVFTIVNEPLRVGAGVVIVAALLLVRFHGTPIDAPLRWLRGAVWHLILFGMLAWFATWCALGGLLALQRAPFTDWFEAGWTGVAAAVVLAAGAVLWLVLTLRTARLALRCALALLPTRRRRRPLAAD